MTYPGNVLFRLRGLGEMDLTPDVVNDVFGEPSLGTVTRRDGGERGPGVPEYIVEPAEFDHEDLESHHEVQLIDLGECTELESVVTRPQARRSIIFFKLTTRIAFFIDRCPSTYQAALALRPPELERRRRPPQPPPRAQPP